MTFWQKVISDAKNERIACKTHKIDIPSFRFFTIMTIRRNRDYGKIKKGLEKPPMGFLLLT